MGEGGRGRGTRRQSGCPWFLEQTFFLSLGRTDTDRTGAGEWLQASRPSLRTHDTSVLGDEGDHTLGGRPPLAAGKRWDIAGVAPPWPAPAAPPT